MICSIHQPNFFPHQPFFKKMEQADIFVILTQCQFSKNNYQNRFKYKYKWHTMRVPHGLKPIYQKEYIDPLSDWQKIKENISGIDLNRFDNCIEKNLANTNINIIRAIAKTLHIQTEIAEDYPTQLKGTERLVDICKTMRATKYISGGSGVNYMDLGLFEKNGIEIIHQPLEPSKSILDILYA